MIFAYSSYEKVNCRTYNLANLSESKYYLMKLSNACYALIWFHVCNPVSQASLDPY